MKNDSKKRPSVAFLNECFYYNHATGELSWKYRPRKHFKSNNACNRWNTIFPGKAAGTIQSHGYLQTSLGRCSHTVHRIIWAIVTDEWPIKALIHENGVRTDNRLANLTEAGWPHREKSMDTVRAC
jgi:hypothetical protein